MTVTGIGVTVMTLIWGLYIVFILGWAYNLLKMKMLRQQGDIFFYLIRHKWKWRIGEVPKEAIMYRQMHRAVDEITLSPSIDLHHMWLMVTFRDPILAYPQWAQQAWAKQFRTGPAPRPPLSNMAIIRKFEIGKLTFKQAVTMMDARQKVSLGTAILTRKRHS